MARLARSLVLIIAAVAIVGCATMNVSSHARPNLTAVHYRTFDWGPADALPTGDSRLDSNPFFHDEMQGAVERGLAVKGIERSRAGSPDLLIHYHAPITTRIDVNRADQQYGYCYDDDCQVRVVEFEAGTIVLDIVDARTNRVIWRGWAQDALVRFLDNPQRLGRTVRTAVARMLERFPAAP